MISMVWRCGNCGYEGPKEEFKIGRVMRYFKGKPLRERICPVCGQHASATSGLGGL